MTAVYFTSFFILVAAICYVAEHKSRILQALGFGYVIYHSDSQKHFWAMTYHDAIEWMACAMGDACLIKNRNGETLAIRFAAK